MCSQAAAAEAPAAAADPVLPGSVPADGPLQELLAVAQLREGSGDIYGIPRHEWLSLQVTEVTCQHPPGLHWVVVRVQLQLRPRSPAACDLPQSPPARAPAVPCQVHGQ